MVMNNMLVSPILKWVGGKRQLLDEIIALIPQDYSTYHEPFIGGGAVLFRLRPKKAVINDSNAELINLYNVIRDEPAALVEKLTQHAQNNTEAYFYRVRLMDRVQDIYGNLSNVEKAARLIYLNKTCYNGLFRVNSSGEFNSPWGKYKNPNIINQTAIFALNQYLQKGKISIRCGDYKEALKKVRKGGFVYLDPPYVPLSSSSSFTGYTASGFGQAEQVELKNLCDQLDKKGIKFLLSNSSCEFIENLYQGYLLKKVVAKRLLNVDPNKRGTIEEVLIRNYGDN